MKKVCAVPLSILLCVFAPLAAAGTNGTYATQDGGYRIGVEFAPGRLTVTEPNKVSVYTSIGGNVYHFTNPVNGIQYLMEELDARTLLAYKPGARHNSTTLVLVQAAAGQSATQQAQPVQQSPQYRSYMAAAEKYKRLSQEDGIKAQIWTACSAAALARAQKSAQEGEQYARQTAAMLKTIMLYPEKTPCDDVIPAKTWREAG